jgi:NAD(P)-dependent dehydrogenase (short-subunit alcohol dehydrogenase family)
MVLARRAPFGFGSQPREVRMTGYRDRQIVVTGGTGALGTAVVSALLDAGAICVVPYRNDSEVERFAHRQHPHVQLRATGSLEDEAAVAGLYDSVANLWASIHVAGGYEFAPIGETTKDRLMRQINNNLVSCFLCCRAAVLAMRRGGAGGRIVNVAARQALEPRIGAKMSAYTASKAAVAALTAALAEEVAGEGILVNAVAPSIMDTPANRASMPKADYTKWPKVEEVARTILFLASPDNVVTRGGIVPTYGAA